MPASPTLDTSVPRPEFAVRDAGRGSEKCPSEYVLSSVWVDTVTATATGVGVRHVHESMVVTATW